MAIVYMKTVAAACLLSVESDRSFDTVNLKQSAIEYESGEVVVAEYDSGNATGLWVKASTLTEAESYEDFEVGFLVRAVDAREGNIDELVVNADAEIRLRDTNFNDLAALRYPLGRVLKSGGVKFR